MGYDMYDSNGEYFRANIFGMGLLRTLARLRGVDFEQARPRQLPDADMGGPDGATPTGDPVTLGDALSCNDGYVVTSEEARELGIALSAVTVGDVVMARRGGDRLPPSEAWAVALVASVVQQGDRVVAPYSQLERDTAEDVSFARKFGAYCLASGGFRVW